MWNSWSTSRSGVVATCRNWLFKSPRGKEKLNFSQWCSKHSLKHLSAQLKEARNLELIQRCSGGVTRYFAGCLRFNWVLIMAPHPKHVIPPLAWDYRMDSPGIRFCGNPSGDTNLRLNIVCWHHPYHHVSSWNLCTVAISKEHLWVYIYIYREKAVSMTTFRGNIWNMIPAQQSSWLVTTSQIYWKSETPPRTDLKEFRYFLRSQNCSKPNTVYTF